MKSLFRILCVLFAVATLPSLAQADGPVYGLDNYGNYYHGYDNGYSTTIYGNDGSVSTYRRTGPNSFYVQRTPAYRHSYQRSYGDGGIRTSIRHRSW